MIYVRYIVTWLTGVYDMGKIESESESILVGFVLLISIVFILLFFVLRMVFAYNNTIMVEQKTYQYKGVVEQRLLTDITNCWEGVCVSESVYKYVIINEKNERIEQIFPFSTCVGTLYGYVGETITYQVIQTKYKNGTVRNNLKFNFCE